jgi:hypothetical protein
MPSQLVLPSMGIKEETKKPRRIESILVMIIYYRRLNMKPKPLGGELISLRYIWLEFLFVFIVVKALALSHMGSAVDSF